MLHRHRRGQVHASQPSRPVVLVDLFDARPVFGDGLQQGFGQRHDPAERRRLGARQPERSEARRAKEPEEATEAIFITLSTSHRHRAAIHVHILHPQSQRLRHPEAATERRR